MHYKPVATDPMLIHYEICHSQLLWTRMRWTGLIRELCVVFYLQVPLHMYWPYEGKQEGNTYQLMAVSAIESVLVEESNGACLMIYVVRVGGPEVLTPLWNCWLYNHCCCMRLLTFIIFPHIFATSKVMHARHLPSVCYRNGFFLFSEWLHVDNSSVCVLEENKTLQCKS